MKIDIYAHIMPRKYVDRLAKHISNKASEVYESIRTLWNLEERFQIMDKYGDMMQVLTPTGPPVELVTQPKESSELAKLYNDEMAELVAKYPSRFVAATACLPMNNIDAALEEGHRAITELGFKGIMIHTPIYDSGPTITKPLDLPELMPLYQMMSGYDLPIWLHPIREPSMPDYTIENESKYGIYHIFGWPYETTVAMTRLVFSGVLKKYPDLKIITHHCGAMVPYLAERVTGLYEYHGVRRRAKFAEKLSRPPTEYFRMFYNDTAIYGNTPALMCAYAFFGIKRLLFGTDVPWDAELGNRYTRDTIDAIEHMDIPNSEKEEIFQGNARALLNLGIIKNR